MLLEMMIDELVDGVRVDHPLVRPGRRLAMPALVRPRVEEKLARANLNSRRHRAAVVLHGGSPR